MKIILDETKYAHVSATLRERLFSFVRAAEFREMQIGQWTWQYLDLGPRDGSPLLFFTGGIKFPLFSFSVIEAFSRCCRVIAPAQPQCRTLAQYFEGIDAILSAERIRRFSLAGSSWGGQIAQVAAVRYADRMRKVVLANTGVSAGKVLSLFVRLHRWTVRRQDPQTVVEAFRTRALGMLHDTPEADTFWQAVFEDLYARHMSYEDHLSLLDTQIDYLEHYGPALAKRGFSIPMLVLVCRDESAGTPRMRRALLKAYPHARIREFAAGGHHPALLHFDEYRRVVEEFLLEPEG